LQEKQRRINSTKRPISLRPAKTVVGFDGSWVVCFFVFFTAQHIVCVCFTDHILDRGTSEVFLGICSHSLSHCCIMLSYYRHLHLTLLVFTRTKYREYDVLYISSLRNEAWDLIPGFSR
jgi:hypothetical protein